MWGNAARGATVFRRASNCLHCHTLGSLVLHLSICASMLYFSTFHVSPTTPPKDCPHGLQTRSLFLEDGRAFVDPSDTCQRNTRNHEHSSDNKMFLEFPYSSLLFVEKYVYSYR